MPLSLPTLLDLDTRLQRAASRLEPHTRHKSRGRVEGDIVRRIAWPRYLVWRSFLQRKPTQQSFNQAAKRLRGHMFYHLALAAQANGLPLPVKPGTHVPDWALRRVERAQQPDSTPADENDPITFWEQAGWDEGLYPRDLLSAEEQASYAAWLAETLKSLDFEFWLHDVAMNDMAVLQMLDAAYNQQAATQAGQELIAEAGLAGDFDLVDPNVLAYLQAQAGTWISSIDDTTRSFIARTLWEGFGGDMSHIIALSPEQIANEVRTIWGQLGNNLEAMSRYRARMITVTELARAETFGQMLSIMGLGIKNKEWMVTSGACIICMGNASMGAIPLMQPFPSGDLAPPGHPLCRCSLSPAPSADDEREGMYTYDPAAIADLVNNPSMAYWPNADGSAESVDLSAFGQPATPIQVDWRSPQAAMLGWATLPDSLQGLISQQPFDGALALARFGQSLADLVDERVVQPRREAANMPHTPQDTAIAEEIYTLDSLLGEMDDADLQAAADDVPQTLSERWASLIDSLRANLEDTGEE